MKLSKNAKTKMMSILAALITSLSVSVAAYGQKPLTGTRLNSAGSANPRTVIRFQQPDEVAEIERLLGRGKTGKALKVALGFVRQVEKSGMDSNSRYFAHNSLCVVYSKMGENAKAIGECDLAIEAMPGHWSAWNNRGTLHYLAGNYAEAKKDYQRALRQAPNREHVAEMLRHNLSLVDFYLSSSEGS